MRPSEKAGKAVPLQLGEWRGQRDEAVDPQVLEAAIRAHEGDSEREVLKSDHRSIVTATPANGRAVVVKEVLKGGVRRRVADVFRGTPGRRAFAAGRRLAALGIEVARPLAFLERRSYGLPTRSLLVSDDLRENPTADRALESDKLILNVLTDLAIALHETGAIHGDLRAQHVHISDRAKPQLIDLESLRFYRSLTDTQRVEDLAQLNASIANHLATSQERRAALDRYTRALPFQANNQEIAKRITALSLARNHRYTRELLADG